MTGSVTINGTTYSLGFSDLTPADVLPVFRTDTSILKTDSILLHAAGAQQNSAKKVLIPHLISLMASAVAEDVALTIEPYFDENDEYQGMYWHFNGQWLRRSDTGEMISVTDDAAEIAQAAEQAVQATLDAQAATTAANNTERRVAANEETREQAETLREQQAQSDHSRAEQDHEAAVTATNGAENVNATLVGMTVTVTDRNGTSRSQNIGFEILPENVYPSEAAMTSAAANVLAGKFCMIATTDKTSEENARLYTKNSAGGFTFLSDLDQASTSAFADWMDNYKPVIEADHTRAEQDHSTASADHTQAGTDHTRAEQDHSTAGADHTQAGQDHTRAEQDHTTADDDHNQAGRDHTRAEQDHTTANDDHEQAGRDHTRAEQDHTTADTDHNRAEQDHQKATDATDAANAQAVRAKAMNDNPWEIRDDGYIWVWDETHDNGDGTTGAMVQTNKMIIGFSDLTAEQRQSMIDDFYAGLVFASTETCESIIDELV